jgi:tetratricopeptide (TPR) repeat protein
MTNTIVSNYIEEIAGKTSKDKRYIYRGQSEDYADGVVSTAIRRLKKSNLPNPSKEEYFEYHTSLIKDAKSYRYGQDSQLNDIGLLIDLQHYGAATGLIDFSEDFLIALWFACNNTDEDGKVFFLDVWTDEFKHLEAQEEDLPEQGEQLYYLHTNFKSTARIFAQKGVFIFGYKKINNIKSITIKKSDKEVIRQELKQYFNIEEKTLFQDIYGFAQVNNTEHKYGIKTASDYFQEGYEEKNQKRKISLYQRAIEINPDYGKAYYNMGIAYNELKEYKNAIDAYERAIEINLDYGKAYCNMGNVYDELKEYKNAIDAYERAIEINPDDGKAYYNMGNVYNELKEYQNAIDAYERAIEINPDDGKAYYNMGNVYNELKEYQNAIDAYERAIEINPDDGKAYCNMGNVYNELKEYQNAIDAYERAIEINPDDDWAYYGMETSYNKLNEPKKAINVHKKHQKILEQRKTGLK